MVQTVKASDKKWCNHQCSMCNVVDNQVWGYWLDFAPNTQIGLDIKLGKRQKLNNVPPIIRRHAERLIKIWNKACVTNNWDKWNAL